MSHCRELKGGEQRRGRQDSICVAVIHGCSHDRGGCRRNRCVPSPHRFETAVARHAKDVAAVGKLLRRFFFPPIVFDSSRCKPIPGVGRQYGFVSRGNSITSSSSAHGDDARTASSALHPRPSADQSEGSRARALAAQSGSAPGVTGWCARAVPATKTRAACCRRHEYGAAMPHALTSIGRVLLRRSLNLPQTGKRSSMLERWSAIVVLRIRGQRDAASAARRPRGRWSRRPARSNSASSVSINVAAAAMHEERRRRIVGATAGTGPGRSSSDRPGSTCSPSTRRSNDVEDWRHQGRARGQTAGGLCRSCLQRRSADSRRDQMDRPATVHSSEDRCRDRRHRRHERDRRNAGRPGAERG